MQDSFGSCTNLLYGKYEFCRNRSKAKRGGFTYITNILEYLEAAANKYPDKVAFADRESAISFLSLYEQSRSIGSYLSDKGLYREPVVLLTDRCPIAIAAQLGIVYAGCYYVFIDGEMPNTEVERILEKVRPRAILYDRSNEEKAHAITYPTEKNLISDALTCPCNEQKLLDIRARHIDTDPLYIVFTSGSTGEAKGVIGNHRAVIDYTETLCEALGFSDKTIFGNQSPLCYDAPLKEIMPTLKLGATVYFVPRAFFSFPVKLCAFLDENRINTVCWVSSALAIISASGALDRYAPRFLEKICFGSEVFQKKEYRKWRYAYPEAGFINLYGPTEATGMSCYWIANRELDKDEPIPIGKPFRNTDVFLVGEDGERVKDGECGEIYIRGTCLTHGYFRDENRSNEAFVADPLNRDFRERSYKTGDIGRYNQYGELIFVSRKDMQIKRMGRRIELGQIESAAEQCYGIREACAVYDFEKKHIFLFFSGESEKGELAKEMRDLLPKYMLPTQYVKLSAMPRTQNGKIDRQKLEKEMKK